MIDYEGNKDMFVNTLAITDFDNFMKQQHCHILEDEEEEEERLASLASSGRAMSDYGKKRLSNGTLRGSQYEPAKVD
jgi:uncharacterized membrane-anchored protein